MTEDFYDHMKKEQEILNLSYQESLRQKNERMAVWDPKDKTTVLSQIKKPIKHLVSGFKAWSGIIGPGILTVFYFFLFFLVLSGCAYFQKDKIDDNEITITDLPPLEPVVDKINIIACIKLLPECDA
jgi:hypothetical protein